MKFNAMLWSVSIREKVDASEMHVSDVDRPTTVAALSKARNVISHSNTGIMGSNPTQGMDVCLRLLSAYV
jgi:hypothetical protein